MNFAGLLRISPAIRTGDLVLPVVQIISRQNGLVNMSAGDFPELARSDLRCASQPDVSLSCSLGAASIVLQRLPSARAKKRDERSLICIKLPSVALRLAAMENAPALPPVIARFLTDVIFFGLTTLPIGYSAIDFLTGVAEAAPQIPLPTHNSYSRRHGGITTCITNCITHAAVRRANATHRASLDGGKARCLDAACALTAARRGWKSVPCPPRSWPGRAPVPSPFPEHDIA